MAKNILPYYDYNKLWSRNGVFCFVVGGRGLGKTYGAKRKAIKAWIKNGDQFIYLRRYRTEQGGKRTFFDDIAHEFPDWQFRVNGNVAEGRRANAKKDDPWHTMGYFLQLSNAANQKSVSYIKVTLIIFDEFILAEGPVHYLKDEITAFKEFYSTVDRWQDKTRVLFLANSVSIMNPYFLEWGIEPELEQKEWIIKNDGFIVAHFPESEAFASAVFKTRFGQFIAGTEYAAYSVDNQFHDNTGNLVELKPEHALYSFTLETKTGTFSVWRDSKNLRTSKGTVYYVQEKRPKGDEVFFTMIPENMSEDKTLVLYGDRLLSNLRKAFANAQVMFSSPKSRNAFAGVYKR